MLTNIIDPQKFKEHLLSLSLLPKNTKIAVAVSGGADSLCLIFLLKQVSNVLQIHMQGLIVDHKLRKESSLEAIQVSELLTKHGINNCILNRVSTPLANKIQEIARHDRYELLRKYCQQNNYSHLLLAHHQDDNLETMIMRNQKGKNIIGSAGMSAKTVHEEVILLRPLLNYSKAQLINTLQQFISKWVEDPSNNNEKFTRVQIRKQLLALPIVKKQVYLEELQLNVFNRKKLEAQLLQLFANSLIISSLGVARIEIPKILNKELALQLMYSRKLMQLLSGSTYMVKVDKTKQLLNFFNNPKQKVYTVGGCIFRKKGSYIYATKEFRKLQNVESMQKHCPKRWDNRFIINYATNEDYTVQNISLQLYQQLAQDVAFKLFMQDNFVTFEELQNIPCIFNKNIQQSWHNKQYQGVLLQFNTSLFMNKFS